MLFDEKKWPFRPVSSTFLGLPLVWLLVWPAAVRAQTADLTARNQVDTLARVKTVVEVAGSLHTDKTASGDPISLPLEVNAELFYDERGLMGDGFPSVRYFWHAKADLQINQAKEHRELREERQLILASQGNRTGERFTSPYGPLSREELELIDVSGGGYPPESLLPSKTVELAETWSLPDDVTAELLRLDKISEGQLTSEVKAITSETVKVDLSGRVQGEVDGVETDIELIGNYQFDRETKLVSWIALVIKEKRAIGYATPGFQVTARVRSARQAIAKSDGLSDAVLGKLNTRPGEGDRVLEFVSQDNFFRMGISRRWYLLSARNSSAMLRMVEDGDLLATCKIDQLTRQLPGKHISLDGFRDDVQRALGKNCQQIVSASQEVNPQGVRVLRVVAAGEVKKTPIRWIYYHLSNDEGKRLSFIFTHEASLGDRIAGADEAMTHSVEFISGGTRQASTSVRDLK